MQASVLKLAAMLAALVLAIALSVAACEKILEDLQLFQSESGDVVSLLQMAAFVQPSKGQRQGQSHTLHASAREFRHMVVPYTAYAANRSEVSKLPTNHSLGEMFAYEPNTAKNQDLFVFLPGSWVHCGNYSQLLEAIAPSMRTLCLPYDNVNSMGNICGGNSSCWYEKRIESINGSFDGLKGNNVLGRLQSALEYLVQEHGASWGSYLGASGRPKLELVRISGHSQGAGASAMLAYENKVARVVQFSGPCDSSNWTQALKSKTPAKRFFAMASADDWFCDWKHKQVPAWYAEGAVSESIPLTLVNETSLTSFDPATSQTVLTRIKTPVCQFPETACTRDAHDSTAVNKWVAPGRAPYAEGLWQQLVGV